MGTFRIEIQAVGAHGCCREQKDGELVWGCRHMDCPDCLAREFIEALQRAGVTFAHSDDPRFDSYARLTHWPGDPTEVVDDLLTRKRKGSF